MSQSLANSPVPHLEWEDFARRFAWFQSEHVAMIGPTGSGKTSLAMKLLPFRDYVTVFATKPYDENLDKFIEKYRYKKLLKWNPKLSFEKYPRRILWPDSTDLHSTDAQKAVFMEALRDIYQTGAWCVYMDELWWMSFVLGLSKESKIYLQQGRALNISLMMATQRPAFVPLEVYDQSTHLFFWADNDERNLNRISGIGSFDSNLIRAAVSVLRQFEVLYVNVREKYMLTFFPPVPEN